MSRWTDPRRAGNINWEVFPWLQWFLGPKVTEMGLEVDFGAPGMQNS